MDITKIYLVTNCYGDPNKVYIGKTKNCRRNSHKRTFGKQITYDYIDEINSLDRSDWEPLETFWISYFKFLGFEIQNKNNGGGGPLDASIETKQKLRIANTGRIKSKETRFNISNSNIGKILKDNTKIKIGISNSKPILQYDIKGKFIQEWKSIKSAESYIGVTGISPCCKLKSISCGGFIWRYKNNPLIGDYLHPLHHRSKRIIQYDLNYKQIKIWDSIIEAKNFTNAKDISLCCSQKRRTSGGFIWRYEDNPINNNYELPINKNSIPIIQMDKDGKQIDTWNSASEAADILGIKSCSISECCRNKLKTYKGFIWKFKL